MKLNLHLCVLLLSLIFNNIYSQEHVLSGKFINIEQLPIEFAKVSLYQEDSVLVAGTQTDSMGFFSLTAAQGTYTIKLNKASVEYWQTTIELNEATDLGTIEVDEAKILQEITVSDEKPLWVRKPDRLVFNVENSIATSSGSLLDALKVTPGVQVTTNSISIIGRSNVLILIDDRNVHLSGESLINYLGSISAESIQSIEVMTIPPAKYDAQGAGGIINIRYKKGRRNAWKNTTKLSTGQGFYGWYSLSNNFNYNKNKLSFNLDIDGTTGYDRWVSDLDIHYPTQTWEERGRMKVGRDSYNALLKASYQLSEKSSLGAIVELGQYSSPKGVITSNGKVTENNALASRTHTNGVDSQQEDYLSANLNYALIFGKDGGNLSVNLDYFDLSNDRANFIDSKHTHINGTNILHTKGENHSKLGIKNYSGKIDVEHLDGLLSYGAKISSTETNSKVGFWDYASGLPVEDTTRTNKFRYREDIHALYANSTFGIWRLQTQLGLRYEYTQTKSHSQQKDSTNTNGYGNFFPTVFVMYMLNESDFLNVNYSRRIGRPQFWEMDPFRIQTNAYSYEAGNPFLKPTYDNNVELTYGLQQQFYLQASISNTAQGYSQIARADSISKVQSMVRDNYFSMNQYTLALYYIFKQLNWLETHLSAQAYLGTTKLTNQDYKDVFKLYEGNGGSLQIYNLLKHFDQKKSMYFEVIYNYNFPTKTLNFDVKETHSLDLGFRIDLFDKALAIQAYVQDILKTAIPNNYVVSDGVRQRVSFYDKPPQYLRLSLRYQFGNKTIKEIDKDFGNEEEKNRSKRN